MLLAFITLAMTAEREQTLQRMYFSEEKVVGISLTQLTRIMVFAMGSTHLLSGFHLTHFPVQLTQAHQLELLPQLTSPG